MCEMLITAMSVNLSPVTVAQGEVVKHLAGWAALLAAPTLISSWYNMNFHNIPELSGPYSYYIVIAITLTVCGWLFFVLRRARWICGARTRLRVRTVGRFHGTSDYPPAGVDAHARRHHLLDRRGVTGAVRGEVVADPEAAGSAHATLTRKQT